MAVDQGFLSIVVNGDAKVSGRSRWVAADQGWSLRGVPL